jgi:hypothetical protein
LVTAFVALDPIGNVTLVLQIIILFLLVLGLPFFRGGAKNKRNLIAHGYSTVAALILHSVLIVIVMIPSLAGEFEELSELSMLNSFTVWSHVVLGAAAEISAIILIAAWLIKGPSNLACARWKRWMAPIFIIWVIAIINGTITHVLGLL